MESIQVKVCGITRIEDAIACGELGVSAIGCVFYEKSPRYVELSRAKEIFSAFKEVGNGITVGVFVNPSPRDLLKMVEETGVNFVQLHGEESPEFVRKLLQRNIGVIKTLFLARNPFFESARLYSCDTILAEHGLKGIGGTGQSWSWEEASIIKKNGKKLIIAGGIDETCVQEAVGKAMADGVDVSSGVEKAPGVKDIGKIERFMTIVGKIRINWDVKPVFLKRSLSDEDKL